MKRFFKWYLKDASLEGILFRLAVPSSLMAFILYKML